MEKNKLEQQLVADMLRVLRTQAKEHHVPFDYFQIESGATAIGIPDLFIMLGNKGMWVECKRFIPEYQYKTGLDASARTVKMRGSVLFRPGQARMLSKLARYSENVALCVLTVYNDIYVHRWGKEDNHYDAGSARYMLNVKGVTQNYVLEQFCDALGIDLSDYE